MSYKKFVQDVGIIGAAQIAFALRGLVMIPILTKTIGAQNYGIWVQLSVTLSLLTPLLTLGLPYTLVRFLAAEKNKKEIQDGIWSTMVLVFGLSALIAFVLGSYPGIFSLLLGAENELIRILALAVVFDCLNLVFFNVFRAFQQTLGYVFFNVFQLLAEIGLTVAAIIFGYGLPGAMFALLIARLLNFVIMGTVILRKVGIKTPQFLRMRQYLSFSLPIIPENISAWIVQSSNRYMIGLMLGTIFVGYFTPAYTLGTSIILLAAPINFILIAVLSKAFDENKIDEVKNYLSVSLKYFLFVSIPSVFGISVLAKQLLIIFSTPEIARESYFLVPYVALSIVLSGICGIVSQIISLAKKTKITGCIWTGTALVNLGLNFLLIPLWGIFGAAIATLAAYAMSLAAMLFFSLKELTFKVEWDAMLKSALASSLMAASVAWLAPQGIGKTAIAIVAGVLIYGFLMVVLRGFNDTEIDFLKNLIKKRLA